MVFKPLLSFLFVFSLDAAALMSSQVHSKEHLYSFKFVGTEQRQASHGRPRGLCLPLPPQLSRTFRAYLSPSQSVKTFSYTKKNFFKNPFIWKIVFF